MGEATRLVDAYFADRSARVALKTLADHADGVLVSDETVSDFQLHRGDELNLRLQRARGNEYEVVPFRFVGIVREFPTAPKDSFLVANSSYLTSHANASLQWTILIRTNDDPYLLAQDVTRVSATIGGLTVSNIVSAQRQISSSLSAVDLRA